jgi:hypothetical protein
MLKVEVAEPHEENADQRGRTLTELRSRGEMLPKNLIAHLPVQDLKGWGFGGLLSRTAVTQSPVWGRLESGASKGTLQERQKELPF